jgi:hypothetical protein
VKSPRIPIVLLLLTAVAALAYQQTRRAATPVPTTLAAYVPQDALLTIESPDFAALLAQWNGSPESKAWLQSAHYSVFQNSRLFGRLGDAQTSYSSAAGIPAGADLLHQVAGRQSLFAWYDIGKLEFLYITRMPATQSAQTQLLQSRGKFERRHAGNADFYIRLGTEKYSTVAFAQVSTPSGDLLLLATREDLLANALKLIAADPATTSITSEPWFHDATAALSLEKSPPALHMVLNLDRIAYDPHFQSYWIQRNITWTRQFRAAASDLYLGSPSFREERVLLPKSNPDLTPTLDVTPLASLAPLETGVFRAQSTADPAAAVLAIQEKLLGAYTPATADPDYAPDPSLAAPQSGSAADLETRIDTPPPATETASTEALSATLAAASLDAVMTLSSAAAPQEKTGLWVPIHSAVVLHAANSWNPQTLAAALQQLLRGTLTASTLGIDFRPETVGGNSIYALTGPRPFFFALVATPTRGNLAFLAEDRALLLQLLAVSATPPPTSTQPCTLIAAFNHATQRAPYARLTTLIDGTNRKPIPDSPSSTPAFFSEQVRSLSDVFATLQSERVTERTAHSNLRQTVLYQWQIP